MQVLEIIEFIMKQKIKYPLTTIVIFTYLERIYLYLFTIKLTKNKKILNLALINKRDNSI